jgi:PAS domain S-box-containing protein
MSQKKNSDKVSLTQQSNDKGFAALRRQNDELRLALEGLKLRNEEIKASSETFEKAFAASPDALVISRLNDGKIIEVNHSWERLFGFRRDEAIGQKSLILSLFVNPLDRKTIVETLKNEGAVRDFEVLMRNRSKEIRVVCITIEPLETGEKGRTLTIIQDITNRKQAEEQLLRQAEMLEQTYDPVFAWDITDGLVYWNRSAEFLYGYTQEEVFGKSASDLLKTVFPVPPDVFLGELKRKGHWEGEIIHTTKAGREITVESRFTLISEKNGRQIVLETTHDITERKSAEARLRRSEENLRLATQAAQMYAWELNLQTRKITLGANFSRVVGLKEIILELGLEETLNSLVHPDDAEPIRRYFENVNPKTELQKLESRLVNPDTKQIVWVESSSYTVYDAAGNPIRLVGVSQNITERKEAEEKLRRSETFVRATLNSLFATIAILDREGVILDVNDKWSLIARENGLQHAQYGIGLNYLDVIKRSLDMDEPGAEAILEGFRSVLDGRLGSFDAEYSCSISGQQHWFIVNICPLEAEQGGAVVSHTDITELKESAEKIRQSEEKFRKLSNSLPQLVWTCLPDGRCDFLSQQWLDYTGIGESEQLGYGWIEQLHPDDKEPVAAAWRKAVETDIMFQFEFRIRRHDGIYRLFDTRAKRLIDADGHALKWVGSNTDITERKEIEERIHQQASLLDKTQDAVLVCDLSHRILYWNKGAQRLYGWRSENVLGRELSEVICKGDQHLNEKMLEALEYSDEWQAELVNYTKNGDKIIVISSWTRVRNEENKPDYILVVNSDVTEKKRTEEQLFRIQRLESIGTLAGGIAHDLNNILSPILMASEMLQLKEKLESEVEPWLSIINDNAKRGGNLIRQVLAFARGTDGERVEISFQKQILEVVKVIRETFPKKINIVSEIEPDLALISADPTQMHQVLMNLAVNARDAMPDGGILKISAQNVVLDEIATRMNIEAREGNYVLLTVEDNGEGMTKEVLSRIWDPFYTTKPIGEGIGLGLSTALTIIKSHNGFTNVYSEAGHGTKFSIYLPALRSLKESDFTKTTFLKPEGHGELILVVDDEPDIRRVTGATLEKYGYNILAAADGTEALALFVKQIEKIDLVISDLAMPYLDGAALIRALQKLNPELKIIAASGILDERKINLKEVKVNALLLKPFTSETLLKTVQSVLTNENGNR